MAGTLELGSFGLKNTHRQLHQFSRIYTNGYIIYSDICSRSYDHCAGARIFLILKDLVISVSNSIYILTN